MRTQLGCCCPAHRTGDALRRPGRVTDSDDPVASEAGVEESTRRIASLSGGSRPGVKAPRGKIQWGVPR